MFIDVHVHLGKLFPSKPMTPASMLKWMDAHDIEIACVMAVENPEETYFYVTSEQVLKMCARHPDRLKPFCNIDPRRGSGDAKDFRLIIESYVERGAVGFGEMLATVPLNDPRLKEIYAACGEFGLPVMFHVGHYGGYDEPGLPCLEEVCRQFPEVNFIGHAQYFWAEISGFVPPRSIEYPTGPVVPGGRLDVLLAECPNLYADISAHSGYNALTRSPEFGCEFVTRHKARILFGTDKLRPDQIVNQFDWLESAPLPKGVKTAVAYQNTKRLFGF